MKVNFKPFKQASDVREYLESQLPIGTATVIDVFSFLGEQELRHSGLADNSRMVPGLNPLPFEQTIYSSAPAKGFIFRAYWVIRFYFDNQMLAQIEVHKSGDGI